MELNEFVGKVKKTTLSDFYENLIWTSYRYCIGRHSYVVSYANDIAREAFMKISDDRKKFIAQDIRNEIASQLRLSSFEFSTDYSVPREMNKPFELLMEFLREEKIDTTSKLAEISKISVSYDIAERQISYGMSKHDMVKPIWLSPKMDLADLIPWANLASCFDRDNHKVVTTKCDDGLEHDFLCFESWNLHIGEFGTNGEWCPASEDSLVFDKYWFPLKSFITNPSVHQWIHEDKVISIRDYNEEVYNEEV